MKKIYLSLIAASLFAVNGLSAQCVTNYLVNPSFESPVQPALGNNFPAPNNTFNGWTIPSATAGVEAGGFNVIRVNGSAYSGGPNVANGAGNQYVDINGAGGFVQQTFTVTCASTMEFSGWFSRREPGGTGFISRMEVTNSAGTVIATSSTVSFTGSESEEVWKQVASTPVGIAAGTYTLRFVMDDFANCDNAFLCIDPGCVLATDITDFSFTATGCSANIKWAADHDNGFNNYELQVSDNGTTFRTIATVLPTNERKYAFETGLSGNLFYRLKLNEKDNSFSYSDILPVKVECNKLNVQIYPNPAADVLRINIIGSNVKTTARIFDAQGKTMANALLINGVNRIDIKNFAKGLYFVQIFDGNTSTTHRITKM